MSINALSKNQEVLLGSLGTKTLTKIWKVLG